MTQVQIEGCWTPPPICHLLDVNRAHGRNGLRAIHLALRLGLPQVLAVLVKHGANLAVVDNERHSLLRYACSCPRPQESLKVLIDYGMSYNSPEPGLAIPLLHCLAMQSESKSVKVLLDAKCPVNNTCERSRSPLHYAVIGDGRFSWTAVIHQLVSAGAYINQPDEKGLTPLHYANDQGTALLLSLHGARPDRKDKRGIGCLDLLEERLIKHGSLDSSSPTSLKLALNKLDRDLRRNADFFQKRASPNMQSESVNPGDSTWMSDDLRTTCTLCLDVFSVLTRRHHCRRCGVLVCKVVVNIELLQCIEYVMLALIFYR